MKSLRRYAALLVTAAMFAAVYSYSYAGETGLRIGDATGGSDLSALRSALFELSRKKEFNGREFSIKKMDAPSAVRSLQRGEIDIAVMETRDIPARFTGTRRRFAAEALVLYSGAGNPLKSLTPAQLKEIWSDERPAWKKYNGEFNDIHRQGLTMRGGGFVEARFLGGTLRSAGVYRSGSISRAWLFCSPAALLCAPLVTERPGNIVIIRVNGVFPTRENILSGKYPLNLRYEMLCNNERKAEIKAFFQLLATPDYSSRIRESGLILNFSGEVADEKKP